MGNASSTLTQYDIEEVQEHCNHLCDSLSLSLDLYGFAICFTILIYLAFVACDANQSLSKK